MLVADLVDAIDVPPERADAARPAPSPNRRRPLLAGVAAAVALLVMAGVAMVPGRTSATPAAEESTVTLPAALPVHRIWRLPQEWRPVVRAALAYGIDGEGEWGPLDAKHFLVVGTDHHTTRHADEVFVHDTSELSPDGRFLAWVDASVNHLKIDDLSTDYGAIVDVDLAPVRPLTGGAEIAGWSSDGRQVYVVVPGGGADGPAGRLWALGLDGTKRRIRLENPVRTAAAAPEGTRLAVVRRDGGVDIVAPEGTALTRSVVAPSGVATGPTGRAVQRRRDRDEVHLAVQALWAPSGSVLVVVEDQGARIFSRRPDSGRPGTLVTVSSGSADAARSLRLDDFDCLPLAVLSDSSLLCHTEDVARMKDGLTTVDLRTGERRVVALLPYDATRVSVAMNLARTWRFEMDEPWPLPPPE